MLGDRLTRIEVRGLRTLADVRLELAGLTVLIGENGVGKSTIVEALEIVRKVGHVRDSVFGDALAAGHLGLDMLLRKGARALEIKLEIEDSEGKNPPLEYSFRLEPALRGFAVTDERLSLVPSDGPRKVILERTATSWQNLDSAGGMIHLGLPPATDLAVHFLLRNHDDVRPEVRRLTKTLLRGEVHIPFDTRPLWVANELETASPLRDLTVVSPATRLDRSGANLVNCYNELKNGEPEHWQQVLDFLRLTVGPDVKDILLANVARGKQELQVRFSSLSEPVSAATLSDGNLALLAFGALLFMKRELSFLVIDEPESHLHPSVIARLTQELESMAERVPIVVATQSDRLLDALMAPEKSTVVCSLDLGDHSTQLSQLDAAKLERWKDDYRGLGSMRSDGLLDLLTASAPAE